MLDRLVGGTVLPQPDAVVGEHVDRREMRERRQPDGRTHVVGEDEEGAAVREHPAVGGQAVQDASHRVLAHSEVQVAATVRSGLEVAVAREIGVVRRSEVGRAAHQRGHQAGPER